MAKKKPNFVRQWCFEKWFDKYYINVPLDADKQEVEALIDKEHGRSSWKRNSLKRGKKIKGVIDFRRVARLEEIRRRALEECDPDR